MADNFLKFKPPVTHGHKDMLQCEIRGTVRATPEERVRQSVLHWLIYDKNWHTDNLRLEHSYDYVGDAGRTRIRPDIEVLVNDKVKVVVECKRYDVPLDERVYKQAEEYAFKSGAKWIWATNGNEHRFLNWQNNEWRVVPKLEPLEVSAPQPEKPEIPDDCNDKVAFNRYLELSKDTQLLEAGQYLSQNERRFVLAMHRMLFGVEKKKKLPYSHDGVHILKDSGSRWRNFSNASGGRFYARYAEFIAATSGRVEAVSLAVNANYINGKYAGLRLCIGVTKPNRSHHALELNTNKKTHCPWVKKHNKWEIYHDGRMSGIRNATVMEAVREAGMEKWIDTYDEDTEWVYLGDLAESATWCNSKELLANLIHYAIIRTNLREADAARKATAG